VTLVETERFEAEPSDEDGPVSGESAKILDLVRSGDEASNLGRVRRLDLFLVKQDDIMTG